MIRWVVAALAMTLAMSCLIDRRSEEFECGGDADCADIEGAARECNNGFCVVLECPHDCNGGCNTANKTCTIKCTGSDDCDSGVDCPSGYRCTINCTADCGPVDCGDGCVVNCSQNSDCGPIDCGAGETCSCVPSGAGTCL